MNTILPSDLFEKTFSCPCGRTHKIEPRTMVYSEDVMEQMPLLLKNFGLGRNTAILMDVRTRKVAGNRLFEILSSEGLHVTEVLVEDRANGSWPICDDVTKQNIERRLGQIDWILTVGSGVINDLGKWLAADRKIPFMCFATAASMNGYASANVAPTICGMKSLTFARPPIAVLASPCIISDAPYELTTAGLGDVLAKNISTADWYLNHLLFGDYYCQKSASLISDIEPLYLHNSEALIEKDPEAIKSLFHALVLTGISMNMAETTSPASGGEHMVSHSLDMISSLAGNQPGLHGQQVGVGTILMAELYKRVFMLGSPRFVELKEVVDTQFWGPFGKVVEHNYRQKAHRLLIAKDKLSRGGAWDELRQKLIPMLHSPKTLNNCLKRAKGAIEAEDIGCTRDRLLDALRHAHEIRPRFTILDLARLMGFMPIAAEDIVDALG